MSYLIDSSEWILIYEVGQLFSQKKAYYSTQRRDVHITVKNIEYELRRLFMSKNVDQKFKTSDFQQCQLLLAEVCALLNNLVPDQYVKDVIANKDYVIADDEEYRSLRALTKFLQSQRSTSRKFNCVFGLDNDSILFKLPCNLDEITSYLRVITDCNDALSRLINLPAPDMALDPLREGHNRKWKEARVRGRVSSILQGIFSHLRCAIQHEVLLGLLEDSDENPSLPALQLMLPSCPDQKLWQPVLCHSIDPHMDFCSQIYDICTDLHGSPEEEIVLHIEKDRVIHSQTDSFPPKASSPNKTLYQLMIDGRFLPVSGRINAISPNAKQYSFSIKDKRILAMKLGFSVMDFFDTDFTPERIYFSESSRASTMAKSPYLGFISALPPTTESHNFKIETPHPVLLYFAKLLLEISCGQTVDVALSSDPGQNLLAWSELVRRLDAIGEELTAINPEAIRCCLLVHQKIAQALHGSDLNHKAVKEIRKLIYKEVVRKLVHGVKELGGLNRSSLKRRDSKEPPATGPLKKIRQLELHDKGIFGVSTQHKPILSSRPDGGYFSTSASEPQLPSYSNIRSSPMTNCGSDSQYGALNRQPPSEKVSISTNSRPLNSEEFQIAIICALPLEYDAVCLLVDQFWDAKGYCYGTAPGDKNIYTPCRMGNYNVILVQLPGVGKAHAAGTAAKISVSFPKVKLVLLTGICGGVPRPGTRKELLLGDVIISQTVIQYDFARQYPDGRITKMSEEDVFGRPQDQVQSLLAITKTRRHQTQIEETAASYLIQIQKTPVKDQRDCSYAYPGVDADILCKADYRHCPPPGKCACEKLVAENGPTSDKCRHMDCDQLGCHANYIIKRDRLDSKRNLQRAEGLEKAQSPFVFVGRVGSGDTVMRSGEDRDRIADELDLVAFEMEGAGVFGQLPCIVVKGVCDYADSHKNKIWQPFAAATAASVTKALIDRYSHNSARPEPAWSLVT